MKRRNALLSAIAGLALVNLGHAIPAQAAMGGETGGGGDAAEAEFSNLGRAIVNALLREGIETGFNLNEVSAIVSSTEVTMVRHPIFLNGARRDAVNVPALKQIEVDRNNWIALKPNEKAQLVYHEYLSIAGAEFNKYTQSQSLLSMLGADRLKALGLSALPEPLYSCDVRFSGAQQTSGHPFCGHVDIKNQFGGWHPLDDCGEAMLSIIAMPSGLSFHLSASNGAETEAQVDRYSAPATFEMWLHVPTSTTIDQYYMKCTKTN